MPKKAIQYMLICALAFTLLNTCIKYLSDFNVYQIVFFRALGSLFFSIPFIIKHKIPPLGNNQKLLFLRGVVGLISMTLFIASVKFLPMGTAVSIRYIAPIFATVFAIFILKEKIKNSQWLCFLIAFIGVLVLKGFDTQINITGLSLALCSAVFSGLVYNVLRKIGDSEHPVVVVNYFMVISAIVGGVLAINHWRNPEGLEWVLLLTFGSFGYFAQLYMTKAFQLAETNQVAPFKYAEVIFTMIVGVIWFHEIYTLWSVIGVVLIVLGLLLNVYVKRK
ncbi:DMT family transporter [Lacinutrix undariae]